MWFKHTIAEHVERPSKKLEPFILQNLKTSYLYSKNVLRKRWKIYEEILTHEALNGRAAPYDTIKYISLYSKNVLKKRWKEGEKAIINIAEYTYNVHYFSRYYNIESLILYSKYVIKGRWKEIEKYILKTDQIGYYLSILKNEKDIKEFKNAINLESFKGENVFVKNFMSWKPTHTVKLPKRKAFDVMMVPCFSNNNEESKSQYLFQIDEWLNDGENYTSQMEAFKNKVKKHFSINVKLVLRDDDEFYMGTSHYRKRKIPKEKIKVMQKTNV